MERQGPEGIGAIAVSLDAEIDEARAARARGIVDRWAREVSTDASVWRDRQVSLTTRDVSVRVADTTWQLATNLFERLIAIDQRFRIGAHVDAAQDVKRVRNVAEYLASQARQGGVAVSFQAMGLLSESHWAEVERIPERPDALHFPVLGTGTPGTIIAARMPALRIRRYVARRADAPTDVDGFLDLDRAGKEVRLVGDLILEPRTLILGEPWIGKTWVANQLARQLKTRTRFVWLLSFERDHETLVPREEWEQWKLSRQAAYVIIDALDEGFYRRADVPARLRFLNGTGDADPPLRVLAFSRPSHARVSIDALGWPEAAAEVVSWHLLPLDPSEAATALSPTDFEKGRDCVKRVRNHVQRIGDPGLVRDYNTLSRLAEITEPIDVPTLEMRVIEALCALPGKAQATSTSAERTEAVARIAAVLQFSFAETIDLESDHVSPRPNDTPVLLAEAFPSIETAHERTARDLARSSLFEGAEHRYRFRQHFAKERLAAYALRNAPMDLIRRLATGPRGGALMAHRPVINRLVATATDRRQAFEALSKEASRPLTENEALALFDRIMQAQGARTWRSGHSEALGALAHPSVAARAAAVIRDRAQSVDAGAAIQRKISADLNARRLLFSLAPKERWLVRLQPEDAPWLAEFVQDKDDQELARRATGLRDRCLTGIRIASASRRG